MIRALLLVVLLVPQLVTAKPLRCGTVTYRDNGFDVGIGPLPETPWVGGFGTKRIACCVVDMRWLIDSPLLNDIRYLKVPPTLEGRCMIGKHRRATLSILTDGTGRLLYQNQPRNPCTVQANAATVGGVESLVSCKHPRYPRGFTLSSVSGALLVEAP